MALAALLGLVALGSSRVSLAEENYFSDGKKQLTFKEEGERSHTEKVVLLSLAGAAVVSGAVGAYFARDSQKLSDEVSATQFHTGQAWTPSRQSTYDDALGSRRIALVSLGVSASLVAATIVTYVITEPDEKVGYENWQTRTLAKPTKGGFIVGQGWTF
jgi:hypothetical protein